MNKFVAAGLLLLWLCPSTPAEQALWDSTAGGSLFANTKAHRVGDVLKVIVSENSSASSGASTDTENKHEIGGGAGEGVLDFIPLWGINQKTKYEGEGKTSRKGQLSAIISVQIVERMPGDHFRIEGRREIKRNGEVELMVLSGIIRARDISPRNTIASSAIADAQIVYEGSGDVAGAHQPGFLTRLINWFF